MMITTALAALVSCKKNPQSVAEEPTNAPPTSTTVPSPTASPTETQQPEPTATATEIQTPMTGELPTVYKTADISADGLMRIYNALNHKAHGNVAVKISSGEPGGIYFLAPELIAALVGEVNGTIVECNTAYGGGRSETAAHEQVMIDHGFTDIAPVDIMDADGSLELPVEGGKHLTVAMVGSHFANYDFVINLAHFKGHAMAGFGGVIKNMSIGISSRAGKCLVHTAGASTSSMWGGEEGPFLESMAEAAKGMADYLDGNILYINVMNNLSVDCDCDSSPAVPTMADVGILASLDPVAVDQACVDLVYAAPDSADLIQRIESRHGLRTLERAEAIGLGSRQYDLVDIG
jgi:hypothetical protein